MVGIYCRISKEKDEGKGESLETQRDLGIEYAIKVGLPYVVFVDDGISAATERIEDRPEFVKFLGQVANGTLTHVFAFDQSRFERNPQVRFVITNIFKKHKVTYYTHLDGIVDLNDPQSEFIGDLMSIINKHQVTVTKIKVKSALRTRALKGKGQAVMPYGYTKDKDGYIIIDEQEAEVVRRIFAMSLQGTGTRVISETLNEEGIPTRYNTLAKGVLRTKNKYTGAVTITNKSDVVWSPNSIRGIIVNPIHKGQKRYKDELIQVAAIFDEEYWQKVNDNLPLNRNNSGTKNRYEYLLKGLLRCGVCGRNMYGRKREDNHDNHYTCSSKRVKNLNCGNRSINIDKLDNFIWRKLFIKKGFLIQLHKELDNGGGKKIAELETKLASFNKKIEAWKEENAKAVKLMLKGLIDEEHLTSAIAENDAQIKLTKMEIEDCKLALKLNTNTVNVLTKYKTMFQSLKGNDSFEVRRKVINDFIRNIIVKYDEFSKEYILEIEYRVNNTNETYKTDVMPLGEKLKKYATKVSNSINTAFSDTPSVIAQRLKLCDADSEMDVCSSSRRPLIFQQRYEFL